MLVAGSTDHEAIQPPSQSLGWLAGWVAPASRTAGRGQNAVSQLKEPRPRAECAECPNAHRCDLVARARCVQVDALPTDAVAEVERAREKARRQVAR
jgi:hypothetical protein